MLKNSLIFSIIILYSILCVRCTITQTLVIKDKGGKNHKIKTGYTGAITLKGEKYPFNKECKSICKDCDSLYIQSRWELNKFFSDRLFLRRILEFKYDTLTRIEFISQNKKTRWNNFYKLISLQNQLLYIYCIPTKLDTISIKYSDIETLTYSYKDKCYRGEPIKSIFANPNKIRIVEMQNTRRSIEIH